MNDLAWIEISKNNLKENIELIRANIGAKTLLAPCIKSNAYGHGLVDTAKIFIESGADWLCVNSIEEAEKLRNNGLTCPILIIGYVSKSDLSKVLDLDVRIFISDFDHSERLSKLAVEKNMKAKIHIKVDTGMHRQGVLLEEINDFTSKVKSLPNIEIEGLATHFANSDEPYNPSYFHSQLDKFEKAIKIVRDICNHDLITHCDKSASAILYHHNLSNLVRPGIATYGYYPGQDVTEICKNKNIILKPALTFKTIIAQIKNIPADSFVGYGCSYRTTRNTKIATIPIGYYDGYDRKLSNRGYALVNGKPAPILGRVCMSITIIDITDCGNVNKEDEVVLIGQQGQEKITVEQIATWIDTINYEVITRLRASLPRYYI